jgi:hypothetical protein
MGKFADLRSMQSGPTAETEEKPNTPTTDKDIKISSNKAPKVSSKISTSDSSYADVVRKAVRWPGKESAPLRITGEELNKLKAAVRHFQDQGYPTDRTQIIRVSLNYLLHDFEQNPDNSILTEIMERINTY